MRIDSRHEAKIAEEQLNLPQKLQIVLGKNDGRVGLRVTIGRKKTAQKRANGLFVRTPDRRGHSARFLSGESKFLKSLL
jgi:hypothetical protein